ncbi:MAG: outer membrane beta-barrel protein, partial [Chthoniobacterales bacterium]|nr:outer membrane beta-barrel protein [Chthoniobacterales bacterium]
RSSSNIADEPVLLPTPLPPDEFVSSDVFGESVPDIGEGRFERRPFRFSFAVYEGYNSNVNAASSNPTQSLYTEIAAGIGYDFGNSRLKLSADLSGGLTFYYNNVDLENDGIFPTLMLTLSADYAATPRLDISFETFTAFLSQPDFTTAGAPNSYLGDYLISNSTLAAKYLWLPKLATVTAYNPRIYYFSDQDENDIQGRFEQTVSQQFLFLWKPTTALVAEYRFDTRNYYTAKDLDSIGNFALLGFDHTLNPRSTLSVRGGAEQRFNQNPAPDASSGSDIYIGPFGQVSFEYAAGKNTLLGLQARYGTTASGLSFYNQGQQLLLGLSAARQFTRRISANAFFNYQNNYYTQPDSNLPDFYDNVFNTGLNVNFQVNRVWSVLAGYAYTTLMSTDSNFERDYNQSIVYLGSELSF